MVNLMVILEPIDLARLNISFSACFWVRGAGLATYSLNSHITTATRGQQPEGPQLD